MEKKLSNTSPQYLDSLNQALEKAKADAKEIASKRREELERELISQAKNKHESDLKKWNHVLELLHTTCAIEAPLDKIKAKFELLGKKYKKDSGIVEIKNSAADKPKAKEQGAFDLGNQEAPNE